MGRGVGIGVGDRLAVGDAVDGNADGKNVVVGVGLGAVPSQAHPLLKINSGKLDLAFGGSGYATNSLIVFS